jgi:FkbM family methyltransferase
MGDLVFDMGLHNGDDTAYYLARGYHVVAVEANPDSCMAAEERFAAQIAEGRLKILNVGIAKHTGELTFWVSERSEWSSFDKANATRVGVGASPIVVPTIQFSDLLNEYGQPFYVKIDIEGSDTDCIQDLERCRSLPTNISFEGHKEVADDIQLLAKLDYIRFKFVRQNDWHEITPENMHWHGFMRKLQSTLDYPVIRGGLSTVHYRRRRINGLKCAYGSSGPLALELPERWMNCAEVLAVVEYHIAVSRKLRAGPLEEWFDIHASRGTD